MIGPCEGSRRLARPTPCSGSALTILYDCHASQVAAPQSRPRPGGFHIWRQRSQFPSPKSSPLATPDSATRNAGPSPRGSMVPPPRRHLRARVRQRTRWSATWRHSLQRCMPPTYQRKPSPIRPCTPTALGPVDIDAEIRHYIEDCQVLPGLPFDIDACAAVWTEAVALPVPSKDARHWVHSDLLAENLLVLGDRLAAVLDFGALSVGDPSVDLIIAWEVLGPAARQVFRSSLSVDDVTWQRGRGWALAIAVMTFPYYWTSMPSRCSARLAMARQVLADRA